MYIVKRTWVRVRLFLFYTVYASPVFAADQELPQRYDWPWWHAPHVPHVHPFWWIFPLLFFVFMFVMFAWMMRRGGMGWMCGRGMMDKPEFRDVMKRDSGGQSESALKILNRRYANGEIDKQEYEGKTEAITRSR